MYSLITSNILIKATTFKNYYYKVIEFDCAIQPVKMIFCITLYLATPTYLSILWVGEFILAFEYWHSFCC